MKKIILSLSLVALVLQAVAVIKCDHSHKNEIKLDHLWAAEKLPYIQKELRDAPAWENFQAAHGTWYVDFDQVSGYPHRASGPAIDMGITGSPEALSIHFLDNYLTDFGFNTDNLQLRNINTGLKYHYVDFNQYHEGVKILYSRITLRVTLDGRIAMFGIDYFNNIDIDTTPSISETDILGYAVADLNSNYVTEEGLLDAEPIILPIPQGDHYLYKLVYSVETRIESPNEIPEWYHSLVDAQDGTVYQRLNKVCTFAPSENAMLTNDVQVDGEVVSNPNQFSGNQGMPYIEVNVDGATYNADVDGFLNYTGNNGDIANIPLKGFWSSVFKGNDTNNQSVLSGITLNQGTNDIDFNNSGFNVLTTETSVYKHVNSIHDNFKLITGSTAMDFQLTTNVERTDGDCNAYYDGSSINFFAEGTSSCWSLALFEDVVAHEYGHGINYDYYAALGSGGMGNGALQEGYADIWALTLTEYPILSEGYLLSSSNSFIRRYDQDPKVYPEDLIGQVHNDGEIIAGAWWDTYLEIGDLEYMKTLFAESFMATPDGPDGNEGSIYTDILLDALMADDDDADLSNGTPNDAEIATAFSIHGISLLGNVGMDHTQLEVADANTPITIETEVDVDFPIYLGDVLCHYRTDNTQAFTSMTMSSANFADYSVGIPAQPEGTIIEYYFSILDNNGAAALVIPFRADETPLANLPYFTLVGYDEMITENFDIFTGQSWVFDPMGADNASTGQWQIESPNASFQTDLGFIVQPGTDHTPNNATNNCLVTENGNSGDAYNLHDVDNGATSVASPTWDVTGMADPIISYWRWFSNRASANPGNDYIKVFITNNGGTDWIKVERNNIEDVSWRQNVIRISDYVTPNDMIQVMFIAEDSIILNQGLEFDGGSIVEAAFDDVQVYDRTSSIEGPEANFSWILSQNNASFTDNSTGDPSSWSWDFGDGAGTSTDENPSYTYAATGTYNVCLTVTNAGGSNTTCEMVTISETGIEEYLAGFSVYPNPANDILQFTLKGGIEAESVEIYDNTGRTVYLQSGIQTKSIPLEAFSEGLYWISVHTGDIQLRSSFVISR